MAPKLNSHCWYDMKLAAAKKPDLKRGRHSRKEAEVEKRTDKKETMNKRASQPTQQVAEIQVVSVCLNLRG